MKHLFIIVAFHLYAGSSFAQRLQNDFSCKAINKYGKTIEVSLTDIRMQNLIKIKHANSEICDFRITDASYEEKSVVPMMLLNVSIQNKCATKKEFNVLTKGFIKVYLQKEKQAYVHVLIGHDPILCEINQFNSQKLAGFIKMNFK